MNPHWNRFRRLCAWLIGAVFAISGILKLMDYVGTGLIVSEYFKFFHTEFLSGLARPVGLALAFVEAATGAALMSGVWRKITALVTGILLLFFTTITVLLVIYNPAMDCGCFGEAVHLTHSQTLIKNLILVGLALVAFLPVGSLGEPKPIKTVTFALAAVSLVGFAAISVRTLPLKDFTPLRPGAVLAAAEVPDDSLEIQRFDAEYIYEKNGIQKTFTIENLPDSTWTFVNAITVEKKSKGEAPVLAVIDSLGGSCDDLAARGKVLVASVYKADADTAKYSAVMGVLEDAASAGFTPLVLSTVPLDGPYYTSDYRSLISLNRSNFGLTYLEDGMVVRKWTLSKAPSKEDLEQLSTVDPLDTMTSYETRGELRFQAFLLYFFAVLILL